MLLILQRHDQIADALPGTLRINGKHVCDTLENPKYKIAAGFYPVSLSISPRFGELLPLIDRVIGRSGIRIHPGNTAADSHGCILVGEWDDRQPRLLSSRRTFNALRATLLEVQQRREEIWIEVKDVPDPTDAGYDQATARGMADMPEFDSIDEDFG